MLFKTELAAKGLINSNVLITLGSTSVLQYIYIYKINLTFVGKKFLNAVKGSQGPKKQDFQKNKKTSPDIHPRNKVYQISAKSNHFWAL